jgi:hypothetical protein
MVKGGQKVGEKKVEGVFQVKETDASPAPAGKSV